MALVLLARLRAQQRCSTVPAWLLSTTSRHLSCSASSSNGASTSTAEATRAYLESSKLRKVLVANRGEIACRVMATARKLGLRTVAVYSEADKHSQHVQMADEAYLIGGAAARDSYLRAEAVLRAAQRSGASAIHPGYGFLSENAAFAEACAQAGVAFVGPPADAIRAMGDKAQAKKVMSQAGVPVVPGYHGDAQDDASLIAASKDIGFPLLVKAVAGGGGKGMKLAMTREELPEAIASARREAAAAVGDDRLLLERYIMRPRHVEVQVIADGHGGAVYLFDRDCSVQRRHQKIIEEAPAPGLPGEFHAMIGEAAVRAAKAVGYRNAGTVEFIVDVDAPPSSAQGGAAGTFFFMEMNTRLQVEHPVSEAVAGVDLVEWQLLVAAGGRLPFDQNQVFFGPQVRGAGPRGHSFEARLYAESPRNNFLPGAGTVARWRPPAGALSFQVPALPAESVGEAYVRVDSGVREGDSVGTNYDPMIAKIITWAPDRAQALEALRRALAQTQVAGLPTNLAYLRRLADHPAFINCELDTGFVKRHADVLLAPQVVPHSVAAVAAVARHLLKVVAGSAVRPSGAWGVPDAKRLWHHAKLRFQDMSVPEALLLSHDQQAAAQPAAQHGAGAAGGKQHHHEQHKEQHGLDVSVTVLSEGDFDVTVHGLPTSPAAAAAAAAPGAAPAAGGHAEEHPSRHSAQSVVVRGARLQGGTGRLEAEVQQRRVLADVVTFKQGGDEVLCVWMDQEQYEFRWPVQKWSKDVRSVAGSAAAGAHVRAPMPGRVVKVLAEEGQQVAAGATLVVIEAMKMEHPVHAHRAGKVTQLAVAPGVQVSDGQVLAVLVDEDKAAAKPAAAKPA